MHCNFDREITMREKFYNPNAEINYDVVYKSIHKQVKSYLSEHKIKGLVIGVSGGLDSGINAAILSPICEELGIPLIGAYIHIETNKEEERMRADMIGEQFCSKYESIDLTEAYKGLLPFIDNNDEVTTMRDKIRLGNIKARLRMMYLYNLAHKEESIVVDNDNMTEHLLGFWTINGDVGDITPLFSLLKTEVYDFAKYVVTLLDNNDKKKALNSVIEAVPTDGLGITSSDVEQFGVKSYSEVDDILVHYLNDNGYDDVMNTYLYPRYGKEVVDKVISRHRNSNFKRNHPKRIFV